jgi:hypothetical protein
MSTLAEQLGYTRDARILIVHADQLGFCHAANVGVYGSLRQGVATSASLMVPCPWARGAAAAYRGDDVGVRLTVIAEHDRYRWGPITHAPSLLDGDGGFPRTVTDLWDHADVEEVRRECRAQVERAIVWGFDVSHLDVHLPTVLLRPEFFDVYLELALEFQLPLRLPGAADEEPAGFPFRSLAADEGVIFPDELLPGIAADSDPRLLERLADLGPGVTELRLRPAVDSPELRAMVGDGDDRVHDFDLLRRGSLLADALERHGMTCIGYRELRQLMRAGHHTSRRPR